MARGLLAPLSPNEEVTLRRVALGGANANDLRATELARLIRLTLVEDRDGRPVLTDTGRQRYATLPKPAGVPDLTDATQLATLLKRQLRETDD